MSSPSQPSFGHLKFSATEPVAPLAGSLHDLYAVYHEIARLDHACRREALYGKQTPPPGHTPFRPLPLEHFEARFEAAKQLPDGETMFRKQLARQAKVYGATVTSLPSKRAA